MPAPLADGDRVGRYVISRHLGRGGMGDVYLARDAELGRPVAIKILRGADPGAQARFRREGRITARVVHPNVVTVFDVGVSEGRPWLALEYVDADTLRERLRAGLPAPAEALRIAEHIASGLAAAHAHGVVHLDLKPPNVLMGQDGRPRIADFGLSRLSGEAGDRSGTPPYLAPEVWRGEDPSPAADIWALGVTIHELACGSRPYAAVEGAGADVLGAMVADAAATPVHAMEHWPAAAQTLVRACLHKDPAQRPSAAYVARTLESLRRGDEHADLDAPFVGLRTLTEADAGASFGRARDVERLVARCERESTLLLVGASGVGKSSLVQAGLVPGLRDKRAVLPITLRPGEHPLLALASALQEPLASLSTWSSASEETLSAAEVEPPRLTVQEQAAALREHPGQLQLRLLELARHRGCWVVLVIDQLEEVLTLAAEEEARSFLRVLERTADDPSEPVRAIWTLREDLVGALLPWLDAPPPLALLHPPTAEALASGIADVLARAGCTLDDDKLLTDMVAEVAGREAALPLLQFAGQRLWELREEDGTITRAAYERIGGVSGALAQHAEEVLAGLGSQGLAQARRLFLQLTTTEGTRRVVPREELVRSGALATEVLEQLLAARLLVLRRDGEGAVVELSHEALLSTWHRLSSWLEESRDELGARRQLERAAALWAQRGRPDDGLFETAAASEAAALLARTPDASPTVRAFVAASSARAQAREQRQRLLVAGVGLVLVAVALIATLVAAELAQRAEQARLAATEARRSEAVAQAQAGWAALAADRQLEAYARLRTSLELADSREARGLWAEARRRMVVWSKGIEGGMMAAALSPDGTTLAGVTLDGTLWLVDSRTSEHQTHPGPGVPAYGLTWSDSGDRLFIAYQNSELVILDAQTFEEQGRHTLADGRFGVAMLHQDDTLVVTAYHSEDSQLLVWRNDSDTPVALETGDNTYGDLGLSADQRYLFGVNRARTLGLTLRWDLEDLDAPPVELPGDPASQLLAMVDDTRFVVIGAADLRLVDGMTGEVLAEAPLSGTWDALDATVHEGRLYVVGRQAGVHVFSLPDLERIATLHSNRGGDLREVHHIAGLGPGRLILASTGGVFVVRPVPEPDEEGLSSYAPTALAWDPASQWIGAANAAGQVRRYALDHFAIPAKTRAATGWVNNLRASPHTLVVSPDTGLTLVLAAGALTSMSAIPGSGPALDGWLDEETQELLIVSANGELSRWSFEQRPNGTLRPIPGPAAQAGTTLLAAELRGDDLWLGLESGHIERWSASRLTRLEQALAVPGPPRDIAISPDGDWVAALDDAGNLVLRGPDASQELTGIGNPRGALDWHPTANRLYVSTSTGAVLELDVDTGSSRQLTWHQAAPTALTVSPDGRWLATSSPQDLVRVWSLEHGTPATRDAWIAPTGEPVGDDVIDVAQVDGMRCTALQDGTLRWQDGRAEVGAVRRLVALSWGCALETADGRLLRTTGETLEPLEGAHLLGTDAEQLLVSTGGGMHWVDRDGAVVRSLEASGEVTAAAVLDDTVWLGRTDSRIERVHDGQRSLHEVERGKVTLLGGGPPGTLVVGSTNGMIQVLDTETLLPLGETQLFGVPRTHRWLDGELALVTDLGHHTSLSLQPLVDPSCTVAAQVAREVPLRWGEQGIQPAEDDTMARCSDTAPGSAAQ